ncbi:hypothetical protein FHW36_1163 [Chitinophaga polysaccharea]|uniref:Uncharacterized protein n=1 Tax=Chitinophaga polysaccharea TaxID=1293035 RepID=A0A561P2K1_9BACT|nr:hypothetical protein FHW36_1163 [Chitinophaga polysaccharea]
MKNKEFGCKDMVIFQIPNSFFYHSNFLVNKTDFNISTHDKKLFIRAHTVNLYAPALLTSGTNPDGLIQQP